jgi:hypothetical protein
MKTLSFYFWLMLAATIFSTSNAVIAQKLPMKFGKIEDPAYFSMKNYANDTTAGALILGDYGESRITLDQKEGFVLEFTRHFRAKIFNKNGYDWATQRVILYHSNSSYEKLYYLKGVVYNFENGKLVESELEKDMIHEEIIDNKHTENKFTLPNVREGSIIEYTYKIRSPFLSIPDWRFQYAIPALWSEYRVSYPEYFVYKKLQKGYLTLDVNEESIKPVKFTILESERSNGFSGTTNSINTYDISYNDNCYRWITNKVPAFREEPYMNALINYVTAMEFELASYNPPRGLAQNFTQTWEKINEELLNDEDFGLQIKRGGFLKDIVQQIKSGSSDPLLQMMAAFNYVRNAMKWDERYRIYITQGLRNAWDKKAGSSADINLMLVALLNETGIQADPVILSTRSNGMIHPAQIMLGQFNYVIAYAKIGEKTYLMDATEKACPYNMLPSRCINGQGRIISEKRQGWIDLNSATRYTYTNVVTASLGADGTITGNMQRIYGNYAALDKRIEIRDKKDRDEYIRSLETANKGLSVSKYELVNIDSTLKQFNENFNVVISDFSMMAGNIISFTPLLYDQWESNPFRLEERKFPVDFVYPRTYKSIITYDIPEGYVLDEKPVDLVLSMPDGKTKFIYKLALNGRKLQISALLDIGKPVYNSDEYSILKEFYNQMVSKQAEKVVLKKQM